MASRSRKRIRKLGKCLFVLYVGFLLYFLLITELYGRTEIRTDYAYNLELFKEIKRFWNYRESLGITVVLANLIGNVVVFVPFGFILPIASKYKSFIAVIVYSFLLSLSIECIQLVTKIGSFDVDDLLLNTIGGCVGYLTFSIACKIRRKYVSKKTKKR
ncbi:MAG: VanZ family protein [Eubacteriales bacterium]